MSGVAAVTGATGFIGRHLVQTLIKENWAVRALARLPQNDQNQLEWVYGGLDNKTALARLVKNADVVIHCAGQVRGHSQEQFLQTNKTGTLNLVESILVQEKKPRFLLISSLAAREPDLSWYANSKFQGELIVKSLGQRLDWTIFRPTAVYGPGDRELTPLFKMTRFGLLPIAGAPSSKFGLIYIEDLAQAVVYWLASGAGAQMIYELDDGTSGGYDRYLVKAIASHVWGHGVCVITVPTVVIRCLAGINLVLSRIFNYSPMLTPGKVRELVHHDWVCDNRLLSKDTGWEPKVSLKEGLLRTVLPNQKQEG